MKQIKRLLLAALVACVTWSAQAVQNVEIDHDTSGVRLGYWTSDFTAAKKYADEKHVPMVAFWGSGACGYCALMKSSGLLSDEFKAWVAKNKIVMMFMEVPGTQSGVSTPVKEFVKGDNRSGEFPYMCIYWLKKDGTTVKVCFSGRKGKMPVSKGLTGEQLVASLDKYIGSYVPEEDYSGGYFSVTNKAHARLEAVPGKTKYVNIPLYRKSKAVATNKLQIGSGSMISISWAANATTTTYKYTLPTNIVKGSTIALKLYDSTGKTLKSSSAINVVAEPANSVSNPKWIGQSFKAGEWTMDLDAALSKASGKAAAKYYTLAYVGGDMWCPYCQGLRDGVFNKAEFKSWAAQNNVNLVSIDMPQKDKTTGTFLTRDESAAGYSGAAYLSRNMIADADAKTVFNRNKTLSGTTWRQKSSSGTRLGNPTLLLLNPDKTVAGRFYAPNDGTSYPLAESINRLTELLNLDGRTEAKGSDASNPLSLAIEAGADDYGQVNDNVRWFKLSNVPVGKVTFITDGGNKLVLSAYEYSGSGACTNVIKSGTNTLTVSFTSSANKYLKVQGFVPKTATYGLQTDYDWGLFSVVTLVPSYTAASFKSTSGRMNMEVKAGLRYKLSGFSAYKGFTKNSDGTYTADKTGTLSMASAQGATVTYQISGVPGTVQFATTSASVMEADGSGTIQVTRTGGKSGVATFKVSVNKGSGNTGRVSVSPTTLTWKDGETATKTVTYKVTATAAFNADETFTISLAKSGDTADALGSKKTFTLKVSDSTDPMLPKASYSLRLYRNVSVSESYAVSNIRENGRVSVSRTGTIPTGLRIGYDASSKKLLFTGKPTRPGSFSFTLAVSEKRASGIVTGNATKYTVTVADPVALKKGETGYNAVLAQNATVYGSLPVYGKLSGKQVMAGVATLRLMRTGKVALNYIATDGARTSFSGAVDSLSTAGQVKSTMTSGSSKAVLSITSAGRAMLTLTGMPAKFGTSLTSESAGINLIRNSLGSYAGYYAVTMPLNTADLVKGKETIATGTGYLILRMNLSSFVRTGKVSYLGMLANGQTFSGNAYISGDQMTANGQTWAYLPISVNKMSNAVGFVLRIRKNAAKTTSGDPQAVLAASSAVPYWIFDSDVVRLNVYGGIYNKDVNLTSICEEYYGTTTFKLGFDKQWFAASSRYGAIKSVPSAAVKVTAAGDLAITSTETIRLRLAKNSGIVSGTVPVQFANGGRVTLQVRGVLLYGWTDCGCFEGSSSVIERPLFSGAAFYSDRVGSGTARRGLEVSFKK